ncbi:MAG TPA: chemotaxis protein CheW [Verrucomicrobiae bacterium]|jgi:purine-binding chemotaxis protein CheW
MKAGECSIAEAPSAARPGKYLTFVLGGQSYGIDILRVREILRLIAITPVPKMPPHIRGVINLRGKIIPVLDLRAMFGLPAAAGHDRSCIVVVQGRQADAAGALTGLWVDTVDEVIHLSEKDIEAPPDFGRRMEDQPLLGVAKSGQAVKILLDLDRILRDQTSAPS